MNLDSTVIICYNYYVIDPDATLYIISKYTVFNGKIVCSYCAFGTKADETSYALFNRSRAFLRIGTDYGNDFKGGEYIQELQDQ